jgi:alanine dehydrogenase
VLIGIPKEIKPDEYRVGLSPAGARALVELGHEVLVESEAGAGARLSDELYRTQGARIAPDAAAVFAEAELIVKVKEPQAQEVAMLCPGQLLFTYLHLASNATLTETLIASGATSIAYETITDADDHFPLLAPMSAIAGKVAVQAGAFMLGRPQGGRGTLLGGVPGVAAERVMIIGGGVVGENAARVAIGLGADVYLYDRSLPRLSELAGILGDGCSTCFASKLEIESRLGEVDLVIGAVLVPGARAPHVVTRAQLALMKPGAVLVDVSIDQGGCFETSRATTHSAPTYTVEGISHYCVANMPGAVPVTATAALTNATLPYVIRLAEQGAAALEQEPGFLAGLSTANGRLTSAVVAEEHGLPFVSPQEAMRQPSIR